MCGEKLLKVTRFEKRPLEQFVFRKGEELISEQRQLRIGDKTFSLYEVKELIEMLQKWLETGNLDCEPTNAR